MRVINGYDVLEVVINSKHEVYVTSEENYSKLGLTSWEKCLFWFHMVNTSVVQL